VSKSGRNLETKYAAALSRQGYLERRVTETLDELVDTHGAAAMHGFVEALAQDKAMMEELQRLLKRRKK
jgi:hypothetical protein